MAKSFQVKLESRPYDLYTEFGFLDFIAAEGSLFYTLLSLSHQDYIQ